jgi:hypothetical protein
MSQLFDIAAAWAVFEAGTRPGCLFIFCLQRQPSAIGAYFNNIWNR